MKRDGTGECEDVHGKEAGIYTEMVVQLYVDRMVVLISQTGAVGTWLSSHGRNVTGASGGQQEDEFFEECTEMPKDYDNDVPSGYHEAYNSSKQVLTTDISFILGRRSEYENTLMERMAKEITELVVVKGSSGKSGRKTCQNHDANITDHFDNDVVNESTLEWSNESYNLIIGVGLKAFNIINVKGVIELFQKTLDSLD